MSPSIPVGLGSVRERFPLDYRCRACGHSAEAFILADGMGFALTRRGLGDAHAIHEAGRVSAWRASQSARAFIRCPACGRRDARGIARGALVAVTVGAVGGALPGLVLTMAVNMTGWIIPGCMVAGASLWTLFDLSRRSSTARSLRFESPAP